MIIFDLDGTLADCEHRRHLVSGLPRDGQPNWDEFFARCIDDKPIWPVINIFKAVYNEKPLGEVQIWSGRSAVVRRQTVAWLIKHIGGYSWERILTHMRPEGDYTPDDQLKEKWLDGQEAMGVKVRMVFDDREKVVAMWRRRGIICAQVAPGGF